MTQREYYTIALDLLDGSQQVWTAQELAEQLDCTTQRACAILRKAELDGIITSFTVNNKRKWVGSNDFIPITIEWITEEEYFFSLPLKKQILWLIKEWLWGV